jgi:hypothetical protein
MLDSKKSRTGLIGLITVLLPTFLLVIAGCGGGGVEDVLISRFFSASRLGDRTTSANIAMVSFDPDEDGTVSSFDITSVSEEQRQPLQVQNLMEGVSQARADQASHALEMRAYQDENVEAIGRVIEAERSGESVASRDEEIQTEWSLLREQSQTFSRVVSEAENALGEESQIATISLFDPSNPIDVQAQSGELLSKEVIINANVTMGENSEERTMVITLQKVDLGEGEETIEGRWIITNIS